MASVLIIEARFYDHINDGLLAGATAALEAAGVAFERITVPGIYEIPAALKLALTSQAQGTIRSRYAGYITLGCAIKGETDHYDFICAECMRGLNELAMANNLALGNGVLTVRNEDQALVRCDPARKNFGGQAARACLRMIALKQELKL